LFGIPDDNEQGRYHTGQYCDLRSISDIIPSPRSRPIETINMEDQDCPLPSLKNNRGGGSGDRDNSEDQKLDELALDFSEIVDRHKEDRKSESEDIILFTDHCWASAFMFRTNG